MSDVMPLRLDSIKTVIGRQSQHPACAQKAAREGRTATNCAAICHEGDADDDLTPRWGDPLETHPRAIQQGRAH